MFQSVLEFFGTMMVSIFTQVVNFITAPIMKILELIIPDLTNYISSVTNFVATYIFTGFQWAKMVIVNLTGVNHEIFSLFIVCVVLGLNLYIVLSAFTFIYNAWRIYKGQQNIGGK